ncbi:MAG: helix-turn-helix domain-containing protein [Microbacterium sp.]|uniref:helix-turn-helix domain-containing protein n=1 Tax=Microbacterium sp. TaxID=51671 RepID=UPI0039E71253
MRTVSSIPLLTVEELPPVSAGPLSNDRLVLLLWVRAGLAMVEVAGRAHRVSTGEAILVPPGVVHSVQTEQGTLAVPIFASETMLPAARADVRIVSVPVGWNDWLMHRFAAGEVTRTAPLQQLLRETSPTKRLREVGDYAASLPMPRSSAARSVAMTILRAPGSGMSATAFAEREHISVKTLQRHFRNETGLLLSEWRTRARVAAAAARLIEGHGIGWTARQVGYTSPAGFTRAFRRHTGVAPREFARRVAVDAASRDSAGNDTVDDVAARIAQSQPAPTIPSELRPVQIENRHVLHWAYRGRVTLRIGAHERQLQRGDLIWVPAGVPFQAALGDGSVLLPVGTRRGHAHVAPEHLTTFAYPACAEDYLLHIALSEETLLRPAVGPGTFVDMLFRAQFGRDQDGAALHAHASSVAKIGAALWHDPRNARSLAEWATILHVDALELSREFSLQTGMPFTQWRSRLRMDVARALLWTERTPGDVARQIGYKSTSAFTKAFSAAHGMSPREYQRHEAAISPAGSQRDSVRPIRRGTVRSWC